MEMDDLIIAVVIGNIIFVAISAGVSFLIALFDTSFDPMTLLSADVHELKEKLDTVERHVRWDSSQSTQEIQLETTDGRLRDIESKLDELDKLKTIGSDISSIESDIGHIKTELQQLRYR